MTIGKLAALVAVLLFAGPMIGGWLFMLTIGVIHGEWLPMMPTIGYWSAVKVSLMLSLMLGFGLGLSKSQG